MTHSTGSGAVRARRTILVLAATLLLGTGCAVSDGAGSGSASDGQLAAAAKIDQRKAGRSAARPGKRPGADRRERDGNGGGRDGDPQGTPATGGTAGGGGSAAGGGAPGAGAQPTGLAEVADPTGDHGTGPAYSDLRALRLADDGERLHVTVRLGGAPPAALADGEVQGVGVDVFRTDGRESDYQVFLDGGPHGWRAYLQTPQGFVPFPGSFSISGAFLEVVVPWGALGGRSDLDVSVFSDWSARGLLSRASSDTAPDAERLAVGTG